MTTFDVLRSPKRQQPFVLLQPQPTLQEIFPLADLVTATKHKGLPNLDRAYVGLVEESGSLFAMSPDRFPLVVFGDSNTDRRWHSIDPPEDDSVNDFPVDLESAARVAKVRKLREMCRNGASDVRCLTGVRPLGSDSQSRLSRLLDGAPSVITAPPPPTPYSHSNSNRPNMEVEVRNEDPLPDGNGTMKPLPAWGNHSGPRIEDRPAGGLLGMDGSTQAISAFGLAAIVLLLWMSVKKFLATPPSLPPSPTSASLPASPPEVKEDTTKPVVEQDVPEEKLQEVVNGDAKPASMGEQVPASNAAEDLPAARKVVFTSDTADADPLTDAPDDDTEKENEAPDTTGKRKGIRRKRGKKKNKGVAITIPTDEVEQVEPTPRANGPSLAPVQTILLAPSTPPAPVVKTLVVSETVLGGSGSFR